MVRRRLNQFWNRRHRTSQVAMLHTGRCGSTVLGNMLNKHPDIYWAGEIYEAEMGCAGRTEAESLNRATDLLESSRGSTRSKIYGMETKYLVEQHLSPECLNIRIEKFVEFLAAMGFQHFVVLNRENYLRRAVSSLVGKATGLWHSPDVIGEPNKISIDVHAYLAGSEPMSLLQFFRSTDQRQCELMHALSNRNTLVLSYERDVQDDPRVAFKKLCRFLGVDDNSPPIDLVPTNPFPVQQTIVNYDDVRAVLQGTEYEWMLDR